VLGLARAKLDLRQRHCAKMPKMALLLPVDVMPAAKDKTAPGCLRPSFNDAAFDNVLRGADGYKYGEWLLSGSGPSR
jgi:hypothetical protein